MTEYHLPMPLSSNNAYLNKGKRRIRTREHDNWRRDADRDLRSQGARVFSSRAVVHIDLSENEAHGSSDCANREKLVTDALVRNGILKNDSMKYVKRVSIGWETEISGCRVRLEAA